jgi:hypothetical protein
MRWMVLLVLAAAGCASTSVERTDDTTPLSPICPEGVAVFPDSTEVPRPFKRIATLNSHGSVLFPDQDAIFDSQRKEAAKLGANGVILILTGLSADSPNSLNSGKAIAIFIPGDSTRVATACGRGAGR